MKIERWTGVGDSVKGLDYQAKVFVLYFIISLKLFEQHTDGPGTVAPPSKYFSLYTLFGV